MDVLKLQRYLIGIERSYKIVLLDKLRDSIYKTEGYILSITKWIFGLVLVYFLFGTESINSLSFFGADVKIDRFLEILVPLAISLLILFYVISGVHKAKAVKSYNLLFQSVFGFPEENDPSFSQISQQTLPLPILNKLVSQDNFGKPTGCLKNLLISLPIASIQFLPYLFTFYALSKIWNEHWDVGVARVSFFFTIYFIALGAFLFVRYIFLESKEQNTLQNIISQTDPTDQSFPCR